MTAVIIACVGFAVGTFGVLHVNRARTPNGAYFGMAEIIIGTLILLGAGTVAFAITDVERVEMAVGHKPGDVIVIPALNRSIRIDRVVQGRIVVLTPGETAVIVRWAD